MGKIVKVVWPGEKINGKTIQKEESKASLKNI